MLAVWDGPTPHNLETLCLCYANQTSSKVPISSLSRDTVRKGGETTFSFPRSSLPRCRVIITQREVLIRLGIHSDANAIKPVWKALGIPSRLWRLWARPLLAGASVDWAPRGIQNWSIHNSTNANADQDQLSCGSVLFRHSNRNYSMNFRC